VELINCSNNKVLYLGVRRAEVTLSLAILRLATSLIVGVSSSDRCYCLWLRCYQVTGGVSAVPLSAALLLVEFRFWVQLWIFASRLRLFAFLIHDLILPEAVTVCQ